MRGVSVIRYEKGDVLFLEIGGVFDGTAYRSTKFLHGSQVPDIIAIRVETNLSDRLHWCGL